MTFAVLLAGHREVMPTAPLEDLDILAADYLRAYRVADVAQRTRLRADFITRALPMAGRLAGRYRHHGPDAEDLEQVARLALVKTVDRFEPERGSFTAYAVITITGEMKRYFRDHSWGMHVPRPMHDLALRVFQARRDLATVLGREPGAEDIAESLDISPDDVRNAMQTSAAHTLGSLNSPIGTEAGETAEIGDLIGAIDPGFDAVDAGSTVGELLCRLPERERRLLALRFYGNLSQNEIGERLGISQMHVSRLISQTLTWLREAMLSETVPPWRGQPDDHRITVAVTTTGRDHAEARVTGEIDHDNAGHLRRELLTALGSCAVHGKLVVDLHRVPLLDAAGLRTLLAVREAARVRNVTVQVTGVQPFVARLMIATGLRDLLPTAS